MFQQPTFLLLLPRLTSPMSSSHHHHEFTFLCYWCDFSSVYLDPILSFTLHRFPNFIYLGLHHVIFLLRCLTCYHATLYPAWHSRGTVMSSSSERTCFLWRRARCRDRVLSRESVLKTLCHRVGERDFPKNLSRQDFMLCHHDNFTSRERQ